MSALASDARRLTNALADQPQVFVKDDGGRAAQGYKGGADDCACRAVAIATGISYRAVYRALNEFGSEERYRRGRIGHNAAMGRASSARTGIANKTMREFMEALGWTWTATMRIGQGCKVHLRADELPAGRLVVAVSKHVTAVIDGVVHDTYDPRRDGTRCVYGYYSRGGQ